MCGIIGIATKANQKIFDYEWLKEGLNIISHRGPDASSHWISKERNIVLGHRRLAIIDLSVDANQPMLDDDENFAIVFNGEIYNYIDIKQELIEKGYHFHTDSDTEVVIKAYREWGNDFVNHLNGMFALGLYDKRKEILVLVRDRAGEKPLYYYDSVTEIRFASELKGLMSDSKFKRKLSKNGLNHYLFEGYVPGDQSIVEGIQKVEPAQMILINLTNGRLTKKKYWSAPLYSNAKSVLAEELIYEAHELLKQAVKRQLVSDVPIGILLSGGIDSSLITALAAEVSAEVKTYSVAFVNSKKHDESPYSRLIANFFSTKHTEIEINESISPDLLTTLALQFDEPIIDSSMIPTYLISCAIKKYCTVALGGDGGDELFGGYNHYSGLESMKKKIQWIPYELRFFLGDMLTRYLPTGYRGRNWIDAIGVELSEGTPLIAKYFNKYDRKKLLFKNELYWGECDNTWQERSNNGGDIIEMATRADFDNYLPNDILVKVDRASMLASLEIRAPFLDKLVMEFALSRVPTRFKVKDGRKKILLQGLCKKILPQEFNSNRKQGFSIPWEKWMTERKWLDFFQGTLYEKDQQIFSHKEIEKLFKNQSKGYNNSERIFGLTMFYLWSKFYSIDF